MFKSSGTLIYDPTFELQTNTTKDPFWMIMTCCPGIVLYYRDMTQKALDVHLMKPAWNSHISIVRSEEPPNRDLWNKYHLKEVSFFYDPYVHTNYIHYWLKIRCPLLRRIREEMGLSSIPQKIVNNKLSTINFHLTVGIRNVYMPLNEEEWPQLEKDLDKEFRKLIVDNNDPERIAVVKYIIRKIRARLKEPAKQEYYGDSSED